MRDVLDCVENVLMRLNGITLQSPSQPPHSLPLATPKQHANTVEQRLPLLPLGKTTSSPSDLALRTNEVGIPHVFVVQVQIFAVDP